jgi:hypothetical protein
MSNSKKNKEQNKLVEQSEGQRNSYILRGQDFTVTTASQAAKKSLEGGGQCGDSQTEYKQLLDEADTANASKRTGKGQPRATETDNAKKPHTP